MSSNPRDSVVSDQPNTTEDPRGDVAAAVEDLVNSLSNRFAGVSSEIFAKCTHTRLSFTDQKRRTGIKANIVQWTKCLED
ncbi:hypothetical protein Golomagni_07742 [Golovinomyces magnicellulatus]|nr:hypothetical protein Golomagni_07742 [Golovinomyces magnicellulatus]